MIGIVDYGVGNLFSLASSFHAIGEEVIVSNDKEVLAKCEKLILPGVGAFGDAMDKLKANHMDRFLLQMAEEGKGILGICLGMQLLFEKGYEYGEHHGLGLLKGKVVPIETDSSLKIPHIGWNGLNFVKESKLFQYIKENDCVYFVHSFCAVDCEESLLATTEYGIPVTAAVGKGNVYGCQFHPEKSGQVGLNILKAFCEMEC